MKIIKTILKVLSVVLLVIVLLAFSIIFRKKTRKPIPESLNTISVEECNQLGGEVIEMGNIVSFSLEESLNKNPKGCYWNEETLGYVDTLCPCVCCK